MGNRRAGTTISATTRTTRRSSARSGSGTNSTRTVWLDGVVRAPIFCNPADKNNEGIFDKELHQTCYTLKLEQPAQVNRHVLVTDQFGKHELLVEKAVELCVPSLKELAGPGTAPKPEAVDVKGNHYTCYDVKDIGDPFKGAPVSIDDQFGGSKPYVAQVEELCTPAEKNGEPMVDKDNHLLCYLLEDGVRGRWNILASNQFGRQLLRIGDAVRLCVPATKEVLEELGSTLTIDKDHKPDTFEFGGTGEYVFTVTNNGPGTASPPIVVNEPLPPGLTVPMFSFSPALDWNCIPQPPTPSGQQIQCTYTGPALASGASVAFALDVNVGPASHFQPGQETAQNCVYVRGAPGVADPRIPDDGKDCDEVKLVKPVVTPKLDLGIKKTAAQSSVQLGQVAEFRLDVTNFGDAIPAPTQVTVIDALPPGLIFDSASGSGWSCQPSIVCTWAGAMPIPPGPMPSITIRARVRSGEGGRNCATVSLDADANPQNNRDCVDVKVVEVPRPQTDLATKKTGPASCEPGGICHFDITITNVGKTAYQGSLVIQDEFDLMGTQASAAGAGWSCSAAGDVLTCLHGSMTLAPGAAYTLPLDVRLPSDARPGSVFSNCGTLAYPDAREAQSDPVRYAQFWLTAAGIDVGPVDGKMGREDAPRY